MEYSKCRHIFESTNKFKVMKKLSLIFAIVLYTTLSYGQNVKGHLFVRESLDGYDTLDVHSVVNIYGKDSIVLYDNGVKMTFVVDSIVTNSEPTPDVMFATNVGDGQQYEIRIFEPEKWESFSFIIALDNIVSGNSVNYKVQITE